MELNQNKSEYLCYNGPIGNGEKHNHLKLKIAVSGAAETGTCGAHAFESSKELGREIIRQGGVLLNGATTGFPLWAAMGAKEEKGVCIGLSPAASEHEHVETYRLPVDYLDLIIYTGFGYPGRDLLLVRSSDALIVGCGRVGTIHEFTIAFEDTKPIGILEGEWNTSQTIKDILERSNRPHDHVIFDSDPANLVKRILVMVEKYKKNIKTI